VVQPELSCSKIVLSDFVLLGFVWFFWPFLVFSHRMGSSKQLPPTMSRRGRHQDRLRDPTLLDPAESVSKHQVFKFDRENKICFINTDNVSDEALKKISARLYSLDVNGAYGRLELDIQNRTSTRNRTDSASRPYRL